YSTAADGPFEDRIVWASQGTYGRTRPVTGPEPSWKYLLIGFTRFTPTVGQDSFRRAEPSLRKIKNNLQDRHTGALYFPFAFSDKRPVRAAQGYLVKFPAAIVATVRELRGL